MGQWPQEGTVLLLIDGYNLLHASGLFGGPAEPPTLERSRSALLDFLGANLAEPLRKKTIIVFDAAAAPPGLPAELQHSQMSVRFARRNSSADELISEMITAEADPRHLIVVSSDHQVQRSARQRGAKYIDSDAWLRELRSAESSAVSPIGGEKPAVPVGNPFPPGYAEDEAAELRKFDARRPPPSSSRRRKS